MGAVIKIILTGVAQQLQIPTKNPFTRELIYLFVCFDVVVGN